MYVQTTCENNDHLYGRGVQRILQSMAKQVSITDQLLDSLLHMMALNSDFHT